MWTVHDFTVGCQKMSESDWDQCDWDQDLAKITVCESASGVSAGIWMETKWEAQFIHLWKQCVLSACCHKLRLRKIILCLKACENFSNQRGMRFFIFYFIFFYFNWPLPLRAHPKPKMTEKFQLPYFQKSNRILHVFWAPTCLNSSKTANFSSIFVVKMKKKNNFKKKKMKVWILQNQMRTEKQMRAAALRHRIFFLALSSLIWFIIKSLNKDSKIRL